MKRVLIYANFGHTWKAIRTYRLFLKQFPNDPQADNVRGKRAALRNPEKEA